MRARITRSRGTSLDLSVISPIEQHWVSAMSNPTGDALAAVGIKDQQTVSCTAIDDALRTRRLVARGRRSTSRLLSLSLIYRFLRRRLANQTPRHEPIPYAT